MIRSITCQDGLVQAIEVGLVRPEDMEAFTPSTITTVIAPGMITLTLLADMNRGRLLGRRSSLPATGPPEEISPFASVVLNAKALSLDGDTPSPGNSKLYGTNSAGTKGWYAQPASLTVSEYDLAVDYTVTSSFVSVGSALSQSLVAGTYLILASGYVLTTADTINASYVEVQLNNATDATVLAGPYRATWDSPVDKATPGKDQAGAFSLVKYVILATTKTVQVEARYVGTPATALVKAGSRMEVILLA
jgi:hypothetical protein